MLALFLAVTLAPACGLVWLGWRLMAQDRAAGTRAPRVDPDGRRIAFASEATSDQYWLMENFLPRLPAGR